MVRPGGYREIIFPVSKLNIRRSISSNQVVSVHEVHELTLENYESCEKSQR